MRARTLIPVAIFTVSAALTVSTATAHRTSVPTVKVAHTKIGTILVDSHGRSLYFCTCDTSVIECTTPNSGCPTLWPPLLITGTPVAGPGINPKLLGIVHRREPKGTQVTYNHHPLYRYKNDTKPGGLLGQGFYNLWYVLAPSGKPIEKSVPLAP
jgi:predicted lipoprotein with Yx(FWY)xxD motif